MQYILTSGWEDGIAELTKRLVEELTAGKRVLWLVSGGSNIPASVRVMHNIPGAASEKLTIMPFDERYGPVGHEDSNLSQLLQADFEPAGATILPVLADGLSLEATTEHYNQLASQAFAEADCVIAQLGIGGDSHIGGILPGSVAATESTALAVGFDSQPFVRLTLTFPALRRVTASYAFAFGDTKHDALTKLYNRDADPVQEPAQILKQLDEAYLYSDQVGEQP